MSIVMVFQSACSTHVGCHGDQLPCFLSEHRSSALRRIKVDQRVGFATREFRRTNRYGRFFGRMRDVFEGKAAKRMSYGEMKVDLLMTSRIEKCIQVARVN